MGVEALAKAPAGLGALSGVDPVVGGGVGAEWSVGVGVDGSCRLCYCDADIPNVRQWGPVLDPELAFDDDSEKIRDHDTGDVLLVLEITYPASGCPVFDVPSAMCANLLPDIEDQEK